MTPEALFCRWQLLHTQQHHLILLKQTNYNEHWLVIIFVTYAKSKNAHFPSYGISLFVKRVWIFGWFYLDIITFLNFIFFAEIYANYYRINAQNYKSVMLLFTSKISALCLRSKYRPRLTPAQRRPVEPRQLTPGANVIKLLLSWFTNIQNKLVLVPCKTFQTGLMRG